MTFYVNWISYVGYGDISYNYGDIPDFQFDELMFLFIQIQSLIAIWALISNEIQYKITIQFTIQYEENDKSIAVILLK